MSDEYARLRRTMVFDQSNFDCLRGFQIGRKGNGAGMRGLILR